MRFFPRSDISLKALILSKKRKEILNVLARRLGTSESETLRTALMDYAKELSLVKERVQKIGN
jgi:hypothetical protein